MQAGISRSQPLWRARRILPPGLRPAFSPIASLLGCVRSICCALKPDSLRAGKAKTGLKTNLTHVFDLIYIDSLSSLPNHCSQNTESLRMPDAGIAQQFAEGKINPH